jgi:D-sedoheptulose 7-phosphate isomerase
VNTPPVTERLTRVVEERERVLSAFIEAESERIARACHAMARYFARGGTLVPYGTGAAASDAAHATVEFMHPVIVGKRALPAVAPANDPSGASTPGRLLRPDDIAMGLVHGFQDPAVTAFMEEASRRGLLTILMSGGDGTGPGPGDAGAYDYTFAVPTGDPVIAQEVQETTYHVLWELVHVFFEHPGLLDDACITCGDVAIQATVVALSDGTAVIEKDGLREEVVVDLVAGVEVGDRVLCHAGVALEKVPKGADAPQQAFLAGKAPASGGAPGRQGASGESAEDDGAAFLYPFLEGEEKDLDAVLADVRSSTERKANDVTELRRSIELEAVERCALAIRERLDRGGHLISFGNGGSSTDAQDVATDCLERGWPAVALNNDVATVTAVGNDVGFDKVFARQLIPLAKPEDVALAITTSGNSPNVIAGLEEARRRRMLTCAMAGYDGGRLTELEWLDHLFVVPSDYIPRIQEAQATIYHLLLEAIGGGR